MHPIIESKREAVADLCRRSGVKRLEVFGSAARDDFDEARSDIDFLVEFDETAPKTLSGFFELKEALEGLYGRPVDLVMPSAMRNPYVLASINRDRQHFYGPRRLRLPVGHPGGLRTGHQVHPAQQL